MQFTFEQVVSLICGVGALGGVAWAIVSWVQGRFDRRDDERKEERKDDRLDQETKIEELREALEKQGTAFMERLDDDRQITTKAIELVHSRLSNARKEMVELRNYEKDIKRFEDSGQRIVTAIETMASSIRHDISSMKQTLTNVVAFNDYIKDRVKAVEERGSATRGPAE